MRGGLGVVVGRGTLEDREGSGGDGVSRASTREEGCNAISINWF